MLSMNKKLPFRSWYYFRTGYATYLAFLIAATNTMVTVYYLAIKDVPALHIIFPSFTVWAVSTVVIIGPIAVLLGWLHLKRSPAYRSEIEVATEANPYYYKLPPGYWKEAIMPVLLEILELNIKILSREQLTTADLDRLKLLKTKFELLIAGGRV